MARYLVKKQVTGLPPGYKRLEYIESTQGCLINTGFKLASTDVVMTRFKNYSASGVGGIYGIYKAGESSALYANGTYYGYNASNTKVDTGISVDTNWHDVVHDFVNGKLIIDGATTSFTPFTFTNTNNCPLFARYYNGTNGYYFSGDIAYWKVYRNGVLAINLIPFKQNKKIGMYDTVSDSFYYNTGAGVFTAGAETLITQQYSVRKNNGRYIVRKETT